MKNKNKFLGLAFAVCVLTGTSALAQDNSTLKNPANYKTHKAGNKAESKGESSGELTETMEAKNYKQPQTKTKTKKVRVESSAEPKRNYKMKRS